MQNDKHRESRLLSMMVVTLLLSSVSSTVIAQDFGHWSDTTRVSAAMSTIQQDIQLSRSGDIRWYWRFDLMMDGQLMTDSTIRAVLAELVDEAQFRYNYRNKPISHPMDSVFGPFGDFQMLDFDLHFQGDSCIVDATYQLYRMQRVEGEGRLAFFRTSPFTWRLVELDGLLPFLESQLLQKRPSGDHAPPLKP